MTPCGPTRRVRPRKRCCAGRGSSARRVPAGPAPPASPGPWPRWATWRADSVPGHRRRRPAAVVVEVVHAGGVADLAADAGGVDTAVAVRDADVAVRADVPVHERAQRRFAAVGVLRAGAAPVGVRRRPDAGGAVRVLNRFLAVALPAG